MLERTLSIIKPDAVKKNLAEVINQSLKNQGLNIIAQVKLTLSLAEATAFYQVHQHRPFFDSLVEFMSSGEVIIQILEGENAIQHYRELMGATNPEQAEPHTLRKQFGEDILNNVVHGSDSAATAEWEINFFFDKQLNIKQRPLK